jgi:hypothetical protein
LTLALDVAAKYCNVEKYLEPSDIAKLDEVSMIVYLSDWYYGVALLQKQGNYLITFHNLMFLIRHCR